MTTARSKLPFLLLLVLLTFGVFVASLSAGSVSLDWFSLLGSSSHDPVPWSILTEIRLPRVSAAFAVGGLLALSGLMMQALLRNPLADPYILGVSGGAGLGGVLAAVGVGAVVSSVSLMGWLVPVGAGLGALLVVLLVFGLAASRALQTLERLILTGVAVSALCSALVSLMLTFSDEGLFRGLVFWLLGELSGDYSALLLSAWVVCLICALPLARSMNVVVLGEDLAQTLGVPVRHLRWALYWLAALGTGMAVAAGGMIGFVGLVVPHMVRLVLGTDHRVLIPACALGGGMFLMAADTLARTVLAPIQLPVGVVTALVGAPLFVFLLYRQGRSKGGAHG